MAFGGTSKTTKKKSPTASELKKENAALKSEVESLKKQLQEALARETVVNAPNDAEVQLKLIKKSLSILCSQHPGIKDKVRATGLGLV